MGIGAITNSYQVGYRGYESTGVAKADTFCSGLSSTIEKSQSKADEKPTGLATIPYSDSLNETISENSVMDFAKIDWKDRTSETTLVSELKGIPREIWTAWIETQEELGVNGNDTDSDEKLMHVGLKLMHQISEVIKGKQNGLVDTMQSTLEILEKALQDLKTASKSTTENPEEKKEIKKEKEFYQSFIKNLESMMQDEKVDSQKLDNSDAHVTKEEKKDYVQLLNKYIEDGIIKVKNGDTEPTFAIGNQTFTLKEWDELLEHFDEAEDVLKQLIEDEIEKKMEEEEKEALRIKMDMLVSDTYQARFPREINYEDENMDGIYIIAIDERGIRCAKPNASKYEWEIEFADEGQYKKAKAFMEWAGEHMNNFLFASHNYFWQDYLNGDINEAEFKSFLKATNNGMPNYGIGNENEMHIDQEKAQWAKYINETKELTPVEDITIKAF